MKHRRLGGGIAGGAWGLHEEDLRTEGGEGALEGLVVASRRPELVLIVIRML